MEKVRNWLKAVCRVPGKFLAQRGQSLLEIALFLPILLLLVAGMTEVGFYMVKYLLLLDATREAARFGSNLDPEITSKLPFDTRPGYPEFPDTRPMDEATLRDICRLGGTTNFYYEVACLAVQNLPVGTLNKQAGDDVVITVIGVKNAAIAYRWPLTPTHAYPTRVDGYHFRGANDGAINATCTITQTGNCRSWSLYGIRSSSMANSIISERLNRSIQGTRVPPNTGYVIVEIYHAHFQAFSLFSIGNFIPNPINTVVYTIFPVPAAEPSSRQ